MIKKFPIFIFIWLIYAALLQSMQAQSIPTYKETGLPYIQNFSPKDYGGAHSQNWAVLQDQRGIMYFGNGLGVLEYDGATWRLIRVTNKATVRSLAMDKNGHIYVGSRGEFGYLAPDSLGQLSYVSLLNKVPEENRDFADIWQAHTTSEGIYFRSRKYLFRWTPDPAARQEAEEDLPPNPTVASHLMPGMLKIWSSPGLFQKSFAVRDRFYCRQREIGLLRMENDSLQLLPGGEVFADSPVYTMLPFLERNLNHSAPETSHKILIGSTAPGLLLFDGKSFSNFDLQPSVLAYLLENQLYHGAVLPDSTFVLATRWGGIMIIDQKGDLRKIINKDAGLRDQSVRFVNVDRQGGLWLALNNGLARIETPAPFSFFRGNSGGIISTFSMTRYDGRLYAGSNTRINILSLPTSEAQLPDFQPTTNLAIPVWSLITTEKALLAATNSGVYRIEKNRAMQLYDNRTKVAYQSRYNPNLIFVGLNDGLAILKRSAGQWRFAARIAGISEEVRTIVEETPETLWLGVMYQGFLRVSIKGLFETGEPNVLKEFPKPASENETEIVAPVQRFGTQQGLATGTGRVFLVQGRVVFATNQGLKRFDPAKQMFFPDSSFGSIFADTTKVVSRVFEDRSGWIWIKTTHKSQRETWVGIPNEDGHYTWDSMPFKRIADWGSIYSLYPDPLQSGVLWLGGPEGIARFDINIPKDYKADYPTLLRQVRTLKQDSLIYGGAALLDNHGRSRLQTAPHNYINPTLEYTYNALRFQYAAASYDAPEQNRYQVFLKGFDEDWSNWTKETQKEYTNIPEGEYIFRVRARNIYDHESSEGNYAFTILPPWHRSWWAYLIYIVCGTSALVLTIVSFTRRRTAQLKQRSKELEDLVTSRTKEVRQQRDQLETQRDMLESQAEKLREMDTLKSRFFANISHEFRTPLTLILGPLDQLSEKMTDTTSKEKLSVIERNARRLLRLINELLDLAKMESGKMTLNAKSGDFAAFLKGIVSAFSTLADIKKIDLQLKIDEDAASSLNAVSFDPDKMEKVFANLLANAFKFTAEEGIIIVEFGIRNSEFIKITISDTGSGIPAEDLPYIFDRFYQARDESGAGKGGLGTGIGMALVKELVELHQGSITVESEAGKGTTVNIQLPVAVGAEHSSPDTGINNESLARNASHLPATREPFEIPEGTTPIPNSQFPIPNSNNSEFVLIVEDNPDMRAYIRDAITGEGESNATAGTSPYHIVEAENGRQGFEAAIESIPDLIISDIMMPEMNGYQLCEKLKTDERTSHIPVILLTAKAGEESKLEGLETGADDYLTKPFSVRELQVRMKNLIEQRRKLRERFGSAKVFKPAEVAVTSVDEKFYTRLMEIIEANMGDESFGVAELAREIGMSQQQLHRKIRAAVDHSPRQFLLTLRLQRAAELIRKNAGTFSEIAYQTGFNTPNYFTKAFRKHFNCSPREYREKVRGD